jgi:hypothetical protein
VWSNLLPQRACCEDAEIAVLCDLIQIHQRFGVTFRVICRAIGTLGIEERDRDYEATNGGCSKSMADPWPLNDQPSFVARAMASVKPIPKFLEGKDFLRTEAVHIPGNCNLHAQPPWPANTIFCSTDTISQVRGRQNDISGSVSRHLYRSE